MSKKIAANDTELAEAIGTHPKSPQRWRRKLGALVPQTRDIAAWLKLARERCLGKFSSQRQFRGYEEPTPRAIEAASSPTIADARLEVEMERARKMRMQNDLTEGSQMGRNGLEIVLGEFLTNTAVQLNKFPQTIARFLVGIPDQYGIEKRLDYEIRPLLETLGTLLTGKESSIPDLLHSAGIDTDRDPCAVETVTRLFQFIGHDALNRREKARSTIAEMDCAANVTDYSDPLEWAGPPPSFLRRQQAAKEAQQQAAAEIPQVKGRKRKPRPAPATGPAEMEAAIHAPPRRGKR